MADSSATTPLTGYYAPGPKSDAHYAVSDYKYDDPTYGSRFALSQNFTVAPSSNKVVLSFDKWIYDNYGYGVYGGGELGLGDGSDLAHTFHVARIDVLKSTASTFSTDAADLVYTAYSGLDSNAFETWTNSSIDLTSYLTAGSTYTLRFAVAQYGDATTFGIDNVSVISTQAVPEPASMLALGGAVAMVLRRRKSA
ncbi:MAG: PEP-CTERM sorting domain-containing protein [Fimbriimonas sp.]